MNQALQRRLLYAIFAAYVILAGLYSIVTPIFEVSDELWHYPMVKYLADNGLSLPVQSAAEETAWRQEGSQPPLYYLIAAVLTSGIDTSDMDMLRRQNPHADIGIIRPDGNANMIVHRPDLEAFPWRGTALAVHVARFLSVALGLGTVIVTSLLARRLFPDRPAVILGATALNAFLPMFLFISGSVNNDNLSNLLGNLLTLLIVVVLQSRREPRYRMYVLIGVVAGAGLLAKLNIGFLIPLVALAYAIVSMRCRTPRPLMLGGLISGGLTIAIAGWWYLRNFQLYDDPTGLNVFLDIVGRGAIPANAAQLWAERNSFLQGFWGFFGGMNVQMPLNVHLIFNLIAMIGALSALAYLIAHAVRREESLTDKLPAAITLIWIAVTFISYLRWTAETPASQGRLIFGALSSICVWMALGLTWWLPKRLRPLSIGTAAAYFAAIAAIAPFVWIAPAYAIPIRTIATDTRANPIFIEREGGIVSLRGSQLLTEQVQPAGYVFVELDWRIINPLVDDWSLFVHLVTPDGVILGQRDIYPGNGALATSDLSEGRAWTDQIAVWVPPAAYAPMTLDVVVGWYHLPSGERLRGFRMEETVTVGTVELVPRESALDVPNPISINFAHQIELVGYHLSDLSPAAGETIELTLYWRGLRDIDEDYIVFAHIIDPPTLTLYAGSDAMPANWGASTSSWEVGTIVEDTHTLTVDPDTPPGIYEVEVGLYLNPGDDTFPRLRVVTPDGGMANDYAYLSRVRVLPRE